MAVFFYTTATQMEKLRLDAMKTNPPAETVTMMVVPAAAAADMVVLDISSNLGKRSYLPWD
jgi:hypothetical protein